MTSDECFDALTGKVKFYFKCPDCPIRAEQSRSSILRLATQSLLRLRGCAKLGDPDCRAPCPARKLIAA